MEIKISKDEINKISLMVCTPMYGGMCNGTFCRSMIGLTNLCAKYGLNMIANMMFNESLITRARTYMVDSFMRSECTHLLFIDSDIGFEPNDVLALLALQVQNPDKYHVVGAPYAKKTISWEKIVAAVNAGVADKNPAELDKFVGDFVFNPIVPTGDNKEIRLKLDEPIEVSEIGTGFMLIPRSTITAWQEQHKGRLYNPDHVRTKDFDGSRQIYLYFQAEIDKESNRYLSEDYLWCKECRALGMRVWLCPWMNLSHTGSFMFGGSLIAMAKVGANPTADPTKVSKS